MKFLNIIIKNRSPNGNLTNKQTIRYILIFVVITLVVSGVYLRFSWAKHQKEVTLEAVILAQSLESLFYPEHISEISTNLEDLENPDYLMIKHSLEQLVETTDWIRYAYLLGEREGHLRIIVDSNQHNASDTTYPDLGHMDTNTVYLEPFRSKKTVIANREANNWNSLISVLVPIIDHTNGTVLAVLGIDFDDSIWSARIWKQMIPDAFFTFIFFIISLSFLLFQAQRKEITAGKALYRSIFEQAPTGAAIMVNKNILPPSRSFPNTMNPMYAKILGRTPAELEGLQWTELTHPDDLAEDLDKYEQFKRGEIPGYSMEKRFMRPDGSSVWTKMIITPLLEGLGKNSLHLCLLEDISIQKEAEQALRESERDKSILLSNLPGMAFRCNNDSEWTMLFVSDGCTNLTGYTSESLTGNRDLAYNNLISPEYREPLRKEWNRILGARLPFKHEYEIITKLGERKWVLEMGEGVYDEDGNVQSLEGLILDISDRKKMEENLKYTNEHDMWTGLYNRQYLENLLERNSEQNTTGKSALVVINLSMVSTLSMTYGFQYSQQVIKNAADVLLSLCTDTIRLFASYVNRFVYYIDDYKDKNDVLTFCKFVAETLNALLAVDNVSFGIGIIEIEEDNRKDVRQLLKNLLIASEIAIDTLDSSTGICFFNSEMKDSITRKETIKRELTEIAMDENSDNLFLQFQPIFDLKSNSICGFEALARLHSDYFALVPPSEFIPLAEETKLIVPLGKKIIRQAFEFLLEITQKEVGPIEISINISGIQLLRKDFVESISDLMREMQINPMHVCLEITESILASNFQDIQNIIFELRSFGLKVAIDDLGTGYSSLARLRELNANYIKIDKYFIDKLLEVSKKEAITGDIISMGHKVGCVVIAEGIEHQCQLQYLKEHDCDMIQGYLIAKPLDKEVAIELITEQKRASR